MHGPSGSEAVGIAPAKLVALTLSRAAKACRLYPRDNRLRVRFTDELHAALGEVLATASALTFTVARTHLSCGGEIVFEQEGRDEMVPGRLYWDGLRLLSFHAGISKEELDEFLETLAVAEVKRESGEEDLATLLWSHHFPHVRHLAIDELVEREELFDPFEVPDEFTGTSIAEIDAATASGENPLAGGLTPQTAVEELWNGLGSSGDSTLFQVGGAELETLRGELDRPDEAELRRSEFLRILHATLGLEPDEPALVELVEIVVSAVVAHLRSGDQRFAGDLLQILRDLRGRTPAPPGTVIRALDRALALDLEDAALQSWAHSLDETSGGALDGLPRFLDLLSVAALPTMCEVLGRLETARARRRLIDLLVAKGRGHAAVFGPSMHDRRWYLVRNVALILGEIGDPAAVELLRPAAHHEEVRVRKQVLASVAKLGGAAAMLLLSNAFSDHDAGVRLWAARALAANGPRALPRLAAVLESKEFERRDLSERAAFFEAYAYAGRGGAVAYLRGMLEAKSMLKPKHPEPVRACICRALGVAGGPEARSILEKLQGDRSVPIRQAARAALASLANGTTPMPGIGGEGA